MTHCLSWRRIKDVIMCEHVLMDSDVFTMYEHVLMDIYETSNQPSEWCMMFCVLNRAWGWLVKRGRYSTLTLCKSHVQANKKVFSWKTTFLSVIQELQTDYLICWHSVIVNNSIDLIEFSADRPIKATTWGNYTTPNFCNHDYYLQHTATYDTNREE